MASAGTKIVVLLAAVLLAVAVDASPVHRHAKNLPKPEPRTSGDGAKGHKAAKVDDLDGYLDDAASRDADETEEEDEADDSDETVETEEDAAVDGGKQTKKTNKDKVKDATTVASNESEDTDERENGEEDVDDDEDAEDDAAGSEDGGEGEDADEEDSAAPDAGENVSEKPVSEEPVGEKPVSEKPASESVPETVTHGGEGNVPVAFNVYFVGVVGGNQGQGNPNPPPGGCDGAEPDYAWRETYDQWLEAPGRSFGQTEWQEGSEPRDLSLVEWANQEPWSQPDPGLIEWSPEGPPNDGQWYPVVPPPNWS